MLRTFFCKQLLRKAWWGIPGWLGFVAALVQSHEHEQLAKPMLLGLATVCLACTYSVEA